jgi:hypothetical protein
MATSVVHDGNTLFVIDDTNLLLTRGDEVEPEPEVEVAMVGGRGVSYRDEDILRLLREDDEILVLI